MPTAGVAFAQNGTEAVSRTSNVAGEAMACNGGTCRGTEGNDTIVASNSAEQVIGNGGDDDIELDAAFPGGSTSTADPARTTAPGTRTTSS
ncbi:MAG: hypothetical protein KY451_14445 [Actinobacteria bacterium]|nr:hypothetical protein [Actinomycetota bacterium]